MPVAFGSAGTFLTYGAHTNSTLVAPASIADGDFLLANVFTFALGAPAPTVTPPAGWTALPGSPITVTDLSSNGGKNYVFYKVASGESGNYTFTHSAGSSCGIVVRYTGVDTSAPLSPTPTANSGMTGTIGTATGFTTTNPYTFIIFAESDWADNVNDCVPPTGTTPTFTERLDTVLLYIADGTLGTPGATGNKTHTTNTSDGNPWTAYLIGLKPANPSGLFVHYKFDDTVTTDWSGYSNTGTIAGSGTTLVTGQIGSALSFNGSGYVTFTDTFGLPSSTSEISVCVWVKTSVTDATLVSLRNSGIANTVFDLTIGFNGVDNSFTGKPSFIIRDNAGAGLKVITSASAINDGNWHHVAITRTSGKLLTLYVDGASAASGTDTLTGALTPNVAGSAIAYERIVASLALTGLLDDLRIYNIALTSTEVAALYAAGAVTPVVLTAAAGSYTLTGASAGLAGKAVAASGSYTITGTAAALLRKQVAAAGSYTITGATAALKRGHVAGAGSYTLTGAAAALKHTQGAPAGSYTLTGTAASFLASDHKVLPAAAGAYNLTGTAAAFQIGGNVVLATDPGAYTLTGTAAGFITVTAIPVTKADISFIGQTVTVVDLVGTQVIPVGKGDILFTGQNIAISTTGEQPPILVGGGGVTVPPWRDLARKKRRRYRALEEIEKRLDQRIERLTAEARQIGEVVPRQTGELVPGQIDVLSQTVVLGQIDVLSHQDDLLRRQAQINQMLHEAQRRAEKVRQERIELDRLARIASEEADDEEAIAMLMRFL